MMIEGIDFAVNSARVYPIIQGTCHTITIKFYRNRQKGLAMKQEMHYKETYHNSLVSIKNQLVFFK